jgi:hypothetical protein
MNLNRFREDLKTIVDAGGGELYPTSAVRNIAQALLKMELSNAVNYYELFVLSGQVAKCGCQRPKEGCSDCVEQDIDALIERVM